MISQNLQEAGPQGQTPSAPFSPSTVLEQDEVRDQLRKILSSPVFHNSRRYAAVLKYIVDQTLDGFGDRLKERTIGIEVFDRPPDYDTATDHAVRSAVAEVRKRLAQYYLNGGRDELRIEILPGSYMPQFRRGESDNRSSAADPYFARYQSLSVASQTAPETAVDHTKRVAWPRGVLIVAACGVLLAATILAVAVISRGRDPLDGFWRPMFASHAPVLICIGNVEGGEQPPEPNPGLAPNMTVKDFHNSPNTTVNVYDAFTLAKFAGLMKANGRDFKLESQSDATFTDLQNGPAILVGLLNNNWTERLMPRLRFSVEQPTPDKYVIRDHNNPSNDDWSVDYSTPFLNLTKDYALVLRMVDPKTEQTVIVDAGITVFGTSAAGNFLTSRSEMQKLAAIAPPGWEKKNMELVLSTDVIRGRSGPASIVAAQFW
jgi:hypothetical protein